MFVVWILASDAFVVYELFNTVESHDHTDLVFLTHQEGREPFQFMSSKF